MNKKYINRCDIEGCPNTSANSDVRYCSRVDKNLCSKHRNQVYVNDRVLERSKKDPNEIIINSNNDYAEMKIYDKENNEKYRIKIDVEDVEKVKSKRWGESSSYICTNINGRKVRLDKIITDTVDKNCTIKHINGKLDFRKKNLKVKILSSKKERDVKKCDVDGCCATNKETRVLFDKDADMYLCNKHKAQYKKHNKFLKRTKNDPNEIVLKDNYAEIYLYDKKGNVIDKALIDIEDVDKCKEYRWRYDCGYASTSIKGKKLYLHRHVMNCSDESLIVDHLIMFDKDNNLTYVNKLDNRKQNLEVKVERENGRNLTKRSTNTTSITGVSPFRGKYEAYIHINGRKVNLGIFESKDQAIKMRLKAEKKYGFRTQEYLYKEYNIDDTTDLSDIPEIRINKIDLDKTSIRYANLKSKKRGYEGNLTINQYIQIQEMFKDEEGNYICAYCGEPLNYNNETLEHIIANNKGGGTTVGNVLHVCKGCNYAKAQSEFEKWYKNQYFYNEERFNIIKKYIDEPRQYVKDNVIYIELIMLMNKKKFFKVIKDNGEVIITNDKENFSKKEGICIETINRGLRDIKKKSKNYKFTYADEDEITNQLCKEKYEVRHLPNNFII